MTPLRFREPRALLALVLGADLAAPPAALARGGGGSAGFGGGGFGGGGFRGGGGLGARHRLRRAAWPAGAASASCS